MSKTDSNSKTDAIRPDINDIRIGIYLCHCGVNIGGVVDLDAIEKFSKTLPNVVVARQYKYYCSDNGQAEIARDVKEGLVNRVVVAECSPRMHENTFRRVLKENGLNPFYFAQANIREHGTWVNMYDKEGATRITKDHIRMQVSKVRELKALEPQKVKVKPSSLIIGAGITGINAALDLGNQGYKVYLVERETTIGGHMAQLDKTFPTMDCSSCILTPKMVEVSQHENIELMTYSEVVGVSGFVGNFKVKIKQKAKFVDWTTCNGCGDCIEQCPIHSPSEFEKELGDRKAIFRPFPQAVPNKVVIDMDSCIECMVCEVFCSLN